MNSNTTLFGYFLNINSAFLILNLISESKVILNNVSGYFPSGELTAVIGPSGKSFFMHRTSSLCETFFFHSISNLLRVL